MIKDNCDIVYYRNKYRLKQYELAALAKINTITLSQLENGKKELSKTHRTKLISAFEKAKNL